MITTLENYKEHITGTKARNLFIMKEQGINVPDFFCADTACEAAEYAAGYFAEGGLLSVRSSSSAEDGDKASFAGQFDTCLNVSLSDIGRCAEQILSRKTTEGFSEYCRQNGIDPEDIRMTVIVQRMIAADISGVVFTANPRGLLNETVIVAGNGTGDNVVEDRIDTTAYYFNITDRQYYYEKKGDAPLLTGGLIEELIEVSQRIKGIFGHECDIEFAVKDGELYILQARPITALEADGEPIVLDNSNIVESYPGITLPLTRSFIKYAYYRVFRSLVIRLTRDEKIAARSDNELGNMVDACNGRIYYRISNWYDIITLLPFSKKIIPVWQEMLGVKTKTVTSHKDRRAGFFTHLRVALSAAWLTIRCPKLMEEVDRHFSAISEKFRSADLSKLSNEEILEHYNDIMTMVAEKWDITLVNDMYSFLFTGLLKARLKAKRIPDYEEQANRCISGLGGLESMKPVNTLIELSRRAVEEHRVNGLRNIATNEDFYRYTAKADDGFCAALNEYIDLYGDRSVNELKLESRTFRTDPVLLVGKILQYAESGTAAEEQEVGKPPRGLTGFLAKRAALGIKNREMSRLHRSRLYGMMRSMMLAVGENLAADGVIGRREDIFLLTYEQVEQAVKSGESMKSTVDSVRRRYEMFAQLPAYSRLVFAGEVFDKNPASVGQMQFAADEDTFIGVPCSKGAAEGEVLVIDDPSQAADTEGKILVTKMTDPGWVFLIAGAKGIVAEKGSLLSHTAIISRELAKPAVVGVDNITRILKSGDIVRVDGGSGEIKIISRRECTE